MLRYALRDISREDAARSAGVPIRTLDVWIHRYGPLGGKRGGARVFSIKDTAMIATARLLERGGIAVPEALQIAGDALATEPPSSAVLVIADEVVSIADGPQHPEHAMSVTNLWIGELTARVRKSLEKN